MVATARGLLVEMKEFDVILTVHILNVIFHITGPASRILQSVAVGLAIASKQIRSCITQLQEARENDLSREDLAIKVQLFTDKHDPGNTADAFQQKTNEKTPHRAGESDHNEPDADRLQTLKVDVFFKCLDNVIVQMMSSRFSDHILTYTMAYFVIYSADGPCYMSSPRLVNFDTEGPSGAPKY